MRDNGKIGAPDYGGDAERDALHAYFQQIRQVPVLSRDEEVALCTRIEAARQDLVTAVFLWPEGARQIGERCDAVMQGAEHQDELLDPADGRELSPSEGAAALAAITNGLRLAAEIAGGRTASASRDGEMHARVASIPVRAAVVDRIAAGAAAHPDDERARCVHTRLERVHALKARLVEANLRLVVSLANRYRFSAVPLLDRIQEGNLGLMAAADRFQYRRGFKFSTYAVWWIRQAIHRGLADAGRTVRLPVHLVEQVNRIARVRATLTRELGREPGVEEIAARMALPSDKVTFALRAAQPVVDLDATDFDGTPLGAVLVDASAPRPDADVFDQDRHQTISRLLGSLAERERQVIQWRYGIAGEGGQTLEEIGRRLGLTKERARQIEKRALTRLRRQLEMEHGRAA